MVDCIDRPGLVGGVSELARIIYNAMGEVDHDKLFAAALTDEFIRIAAAAGICRPSCCQPLPAALRLKVREAIPSIPNFKNFYFLLLNRAFHIKIIFRFVVVLAFKYFFERTNCFSKRNINSFYAGKLFRHENRLRKEFLNSSSARHCELCRHQLIHPYPRIAMMSCKSLYLCKILLNSTSHISNASSPIIFGSRIVEVESSGSTAG